MKNFKGQELFAQLLDAIEKKDIKEGGYISHTLKGLGSNLSMPVLYDSAMIVENHLKTTNRVDPEYINQLKESLDAVTRKIELIVGGG